MTKKQRSENVEKLADAMRGAMNRAFEFIDANDGGTCNFDTPLLLKNDNLTKAMILEAAEKAKIKCEKIKYGFYKGAYMFYGVTSGQGDRRTKMAEEFSKFLTAKGFNSGVWYEVD